MSYPLSGEILVFPSSSFSFSNRFLILCLARFDGLCLARESRLYSWMKLPINLDFAGWFSRELYDVGRAGLLLNRD